MRQRGASVGKEYFRMTKKLYVGVDVGKYKHECCIVDSDGAIVRDSFPFENSKEGMESLLKAADGIPDAEIAVIGFEATGHYGENLKSFLERAGRPYAELNPAQTHSFAKSTKGNGQKTDKSDARSIASFLLATRQAASPQRDYAKKRLKVLCRHKASLHKRKAACWNSAIRCIDVLFPELIPFLGGGSAARGRKAIKRPWARSLISKHPSAKSLAKLSPEASERARRESRGSFSKVRSAELRALAKASVGCDSPAMEAVLKSEIRQIEWLESEIEAVAGEIESAVADSGCRILTIPGVGPSLAGAIMSEIVDFARFPSPDKALSYVGAFPVVRQSGEHEWVGWMAKKGSPSLRYALMQAAMTVCLHSDPFSDYYQRKIGEGKAPLVARSHVARKLLRVMWAMETKGRDFNPALVS